MEYQQEANKIRSRLANYTKKSVLIETLKYLHKPQENNIQEAKKMPWLCFLLIEWLFQVDERQSATEITESEFYKILHRMWGLQSLALNIKGSENINLTIRSLLIGQLLPQLDKSIFIWRLFRHHYLLTNDNVSTVLPRLFLDKTGLKIDTFFTLSLWVMINFTWNKNNNKILFSTIIRDLCPVFSINEIAIFLKIIGIKASELKSFLEPKKDYSISPESYYSESLLYEKPLIILDDLVISPHNILVSNTISKLSYRLMKNLNSDKAKKSYEKSFELYVGKIIDENFCTPLTEDDIEALYKNAGIEGKKVDYLINTKEKTIFIEAKAIELNSRTTTLMNPNILKQRARKTFWKGAIQVYNCSRHLSEKNLTNIASYENRYALIITNSSIYISSGAWVRSNIDTNLIDDLIKKHGEQIKPEKILVLSLEDFESIARVCTNAHQSLTAFIDFCIDQDKSRHTEKFEVSQHIEAFIRKYGSPGIIPIGNDHLLKSKEILFDKLSFCLKENPQYWQKKGRYGVQEYTELYGQLMNELGIKNPFTA